ncbi:efflux RND transporter periplasmic adaptor subunit [Undibacterium arcticum]|uniref:Efflux RND transporter periplasmic adaptor subunit n=1 Tax=Undibacterium arcticum TaxID=1762892 RepID=A0ABV7F301_9BURK
MRLTLKHYLTAALIVATTGGGYYVAKDKTAEPAKQGRSQVQIVKTVLAQKKSIPINLNTNGYVTAINTVDVRPQIQNIVRTVHVTEGQDVRAGQLLFTLDARNDSSNLDKAKAQLAHDKADLADAEMNLKRNQELLAKNFVSPAVVDSARNKLESVRGTLRADQAAIDASSVALGFNQITASIAGRIGAISVHPGSLAQPSGVPMLTISQLDPIAVSFSVPERERSNIVASYPNGSAPVFVKLGDKEIEGKLIFIDNSADQQSGTIKMKAQFTNGQHPLWPGSFVTVRLVSQTLADVVVVPAQAVVTGPNDSFVYVVQGDDSVMLQKVNVIATEQAQSALSGLTAGARVVVEGGQNLRPGVKVKEVVATK